MRARPGGLRLGAACRDDAAAGDDDDVGAGVAIYGSTGTPATLAWA